MCEVALELPQSLIAKQRIKKCALYVTYIMRAGG
jgi:hypothetical protein